ncbi:DUF3006 domain-containing protein [Kurthia senegalensis]|uniref:DUF3006 domain-containing protein n=1 Tax=Kurthia senegalensis TaxID=1033740 RepID=UPI0002894365|nr:DUF3006 domain-containing protein [Kurthia senegalensis]
MKAIVDRFENDYVVLELEDGHTIDIHKSKCPLLVKVGDTVQLSDEGHITPDQAATTSRKKEIDDLANDLFE